MTLTRDRIIEINRQLESGVIDHWQAWRMARYYACSEQERVYLNRIADNPGITTAELCGDGHKQNYVSMVGKRLAEIGLVWREEIRDDDGKYYRHYLARPARLSQDV